MIITPTAIPEVLIIQPTLWEDSRGFFFESYNQDQFNRAIGHSVQFIQDNHSRSERNVLRGLHFQIEKPQGKLVRVTNGEVFDVAVDIRHGSPSFGRWVGVHLSAENKRQLWIPEGFAHGFLTLSSHAELLYKTTNYYYPEHERCIIWNDPDVAIQWPMQAVPLMSIKDTNGLKLKQI